MNVTRKSLGMKLVISLFLIIFLFNTVVTNYSYGGVIIDSVLLKPAMTFVTLIVGAIDVAVGFVLDQNVAETLSKFFDDDDVWVDVIASPEKIFANEYSLLNANIFSANADDNSINGNIKKAVAEIYFNLVAICGVVLLCLLIYTGIRVVLASNSPQEQSKWKMYLIDWIKSVCLLLFSHAIMISVFFIVDLISEAFYNGLFNNGSTSLATMCGRQALKWDGTMAKQFVYLILFIYVSWLTIVFAFAYFKRMMWTTILVVVAPVVSVVYPFSGVYNGKEVFKKWFKEFIMNAIIPVFHIIMYTILIQIPVGNTLNTQVFINNSINFDYLPQLIYSLLALQMIKPGEKFLKDLFGIKGTVSETATYEQGSKSISNGIKKAINIALVASGIGAAAGVAGAAAGAAGATEAAGAAGIEAAGAAGIEVAGIGEAEEVTVEEATLGETMSDEELYRYSSENVWGNPNYDIHDLSENKESLQENNKNELQDNKESKEVSNSTVIGLLEEIRDNTSGRNNGNSNNNEKSNSLNDNNQEIIEEYQGIKMADLPEKPEKPEETVKERIGKLINKAKESKFGRTMSALNNSPEFKENLMNLRASFHESSNAMALPGYESNDWQDSAFAQIARWDIVRTKEITKLSVDKHINNKGNIDFMIKANGLQEKYEKIYKYADGTPNIERAKEAAKEEAKNLLQKTTPYLKYGVNDIGMMNEMLKYQKNNNCSVEDAIKGYAIDVMDTKEITEVVKQNIINNNEKIQIGVNEQGKPKYFNGANLKNPNTKISDKDLETIGTYIQEKVDSAKLYRNEGCSIDDSLRLSNLEKKIKDKNISIDKNLRVQDVVIRVDKKIREGIKNEKRIDLPRSENFEKNKGLINLENIINEDINSEREIDETKT